MSEGKRGFWALLHRLHGRFWGRVAMGMTMAVLALLFNAFLIEKSAPYGAFRLWAYGHIQRSLRPDPALAEPPVQIVDIAEIETVDGPGVAPGGPAVSRRELLKTLRLLVRARPLGIGIDVDFSPDENGNPITMDDADFFVDVARMSKETGVPIKLGVHRKASDRDAAWLGNLDFVRMAGGLGIGNEELQAEAAEMKVGVPSVLRMLCWTKTAENQPLPSLAYALAEPHVRGEDTQGWAIESRSEFSPRDPLHTEGFLVSYRLLDSFLGTNIGVKEVASAPQESFAKRFVLLGDVRRNEELPPGAAGDDLFRVPGREGFYSGVLLHGCAVDTLVNTPLKQWTHSGRIALDLGLALVGLLTVELLKWAIYGRRGIEAAKPTVEWAVTLSTAAVILAVSTVFASSIRLIWDDALYVALSMVLHTGLEQKLSARIHKEGSHS